MHQSLKILVPVLLIFTAVSCSDMVNDWEVGPQLTVTMEPYGPSQGDTVDIENLPPFTYETGKNEVTIQGQYMAPSCGYTPVGVLSKGEILTITIRRPKNVGAVCSMPAGFQYQAKITDLPKGSYTVNVLHKNDLLFYKRGQDPSKSWLNMAFSKVITIE